MTLLLAALAACERAAAGTLGGLLFETRTMVRQSGGVPMKFHTPGVGTAGFPMMHFTSAVGSSHFTRKAVVNGGCHRDGLEKPRALSLGGGVQIQTPERRVTFRKGQNLQRRGFIRLLPPSASEERRNVTSEAPRRLCHEVTCESPGERLLRGSIFPALGHPRDGRRKVALRPAALY